MEVGALSSTQPAEEVIAEIFNAFRPQFSNFNATGHILAPTAACGMSLDGTKAGG